MKVEVIFNDLLGGKIEVYENITKVESFSNLGYLDNYIVLYKDNEVETTLMICDIERYTVCVERQT